LAPTHRMEDPDVELERGDFRSVWMVAGDMARLRSLSITVHPRLEAADLDLCRPLSPCARIDVEVTLLDAWMDAATAAAFGWLLGCGVRAEPRGMGKRFRSHRVSHNARAFGGHSRGVGTAPLGAPPS
jgi:hypothetical protein